MTKNILILLICFFLCLPLTAYASGNPSPGCKDGNGYTENTFYHQHCYKDTDTHAKRDDPAGVGIDLLLFEGNSADMVAEYRHDFNNKEDTIFGVIKTKVSLWDMIKRILGRS